MALEPILWALKAAPVTDAQERLVLVALAEAADSDGCNAIRSDDTLAAQCLTDARTVRRRRAALAERGLITLGDQAAAEYIRADRRPKVYDVMVPWPALAPYIDTINTERARRGKPPLRPQDRPEHPPAPARRRRADAGQPRPAAATTGSGGTASPGGLAARPDTQSATGGLVVRHGGTTRPPTHPYDPPQDPPPSRERGTGDPAATHHHSEPVVVDPEPEHPEPTTSGQPHPASSGPAAGERPGPGAEQLLASLPSPWATGRRERAELATRVGAALAAGWSHRDLAGYLTAPPPPDMRRPGAVLAHRLRPDILPDPPATVPPADPDHPWCGHCDQVTRLLTTPDPNAHDGERALHCPHCHPLRAHPQPPPASPGRQPPAAAAPANPAGCQRRPSPAADPDSATAAAWAGLRASLTAAVAEHQHRAAPCPAPDTTSPAAGRRGSRPPPRGPRGNRPGRAAHPAQPTQRGSPP